MNHIVSGRARVDHRLVRSVQLQEIIRIKDDENVPIVIVGNKADLEDQRTVPRTKAFSISQQWGAPYYEASARTRSE